MPHTALIAFLFFLTGTAGLIFEIAWCRLLLRALGAGINANACVFAGFLLGAAFGAVLTWKKPGLLLKLSRSATESSLAYLKAYARLELIVAVTGILICFLLTSKVDESIASFLGNFGDTASLFNTFRFFICTAILFFPCAAMGASFAALGRAFALSGRKTTVFPLLYGCNTLGAAAGSLLAAFVLLPALGIKLTGCIAGGIDIAVCILVEIICICTRSSADAKPQCEPWDPTTGKEGSAKKSSTGSASTVWAACVFSSGFLALVLELCWTRIFSSVLGTSVYSTGAVLVVVLLAMGTSSTLAQLLKNNPGWAARCVCMCFLLAAISTLGSCYLNKLMYWIFIESNSYVSPIFSADPFVRAIISRLLLAFAYVFLPSAFIGAILPLSTICATESSSGAGSKFYAINCAGGVCACLFFSLQAFPALVRSSDIALLISLLWVVLICSVISVSLFLKESLHRFRNKEPLGSAAAVTLALAAISVPIYSIMHLPHWDARILSSGFLVYSNDNSLRQDHSADDTSLNRYTEGLNSTVSVYSSRKQNTICLKSDGKVESTLPMDPSLISPGSDFSTHILLGGMPMIFHNGDPHEAMLIGLGSGLTASTLLSFPQLQHLTIAELEPAMVAACNSLFSFNGNPLSETNIASGRVRLQLNDARFVLSSQSQSYDVIVSQPADPWVTGSGDLFTEEFFQLASSRLNNDGVFCQWIQLYSIPQKELISLIATFQKVFKSCYACHNPGAGELILVGFKNAKTQLATISRDNVHDSKESCYNNYLLRAGIADRWTAISSVIAGPAGVSAIACANHPISLNVDDNPHVEYQTCKAVLTCNSQVEENLKFLADQLGGQNLWYPTFKSENAVEHVRMSRAFAYQGVQDVSALKSLNDKRAQFCVLQSLTQRKSIFTFSNAAIVLKALGKDHGAQINLQNAVKIADKAAETSGNAEFTDLDKLALIDINLEAGRLTKVAQLLSSLARANSPEAQLRKGILLLASGRSKESAATLAKLATEFPCMSSALINSAYAAIAAGELDLAEKNLHESLEINPWDFQCQLAYTSVLCDLSKRKPQNPAPPDNSLLHNAFNHAESAFKLRPNDTSAYILVFNSALLANDSNCAKQALNALKEHRFGDPNAAKVLNLSERSAKHQDLLGNPEFANIVNIIKANAENQKNGYKVLGEL